MQLSIETKINIVRIIPHVILTDSNKIMQLHIKNKIVVMLISSLIQKQVLIHIKNIKNVEAEIQKNTASQVIIANNTK
jgi:diketogulonate reductase-like aldo/keto reductase